jgi:hypothetical protein
MMSSATSIDKVRVDPAASRQRDQSATDAGFRPWHFFVLVSLAASTVAVLMSRRSTPEHLILLSLTIGAAGLAAAAFYRMLAPLAVRDVSHLSDPPSARALAALEREKALVLRSIKELEFDRAMGKVSPGDFDEMSGRLRARAITLIKQVDAGGSGYREVIERELQLRLKTYGAEHRNDRATPPPLPPRHVSSETPVADAAVARHCACGTANDADAAFCKRCGTVLEASSR